MCFTTPSSSEVDVLSDLKCHTKLLWARLSLKRAIYSAGFRVDISLWSQLIWMLIVVNSPQVSDGLFKQIILKCLLAGRRIFVMNLLLKAHTVYQLNGKVILLSYSALKCTFFLTITSWTNANTLLPVPELYTWVWLQSLKACPPNSHNTS